jgi:hypothetical protein
MSDTLSIFSTDLRSFIPRSLERPGPPEPAWTDEEINELARRLFRLQYQGLPVYREFCDRRGRSPDRIGSWTEIPAVPTTAFKDLEMTALPEAERVAEFHSSGTTGVRPSRHFHSHESLALYEASLEPWFHRNFLQLPQSSTPGNRFLALTPSPAAAPRSSLVHMLGQVVSRWGSPDSRFAGRVGTDGWELELDTVVAVLRRAEETGQPLTLLGTAFNFVHLLDHLAASHLRFDLGAGSRVMETGGYKGRSRVVPREELHSELERALGVPRERLVTEYGMSELSSQAYDTGSGFRFPPWARAQIIHPETGREVADGETGIVRILDLANVWSAMAVETGDLGVRQGAWFSLAGRAQAVEPRGCSLMTA